MMQGVDRPNASRVGGDLGEHAHRQVGVPKPDRGTAPDVA